jgi:CubicO group peptidase (beta-lactamase class C family)
VVSGAPAATGGSGFVSTLSLMARFGALIFGGGGVGGGQKERPSLTNLSMLLKPPPKL